MPPTAAADSFPLAGTPAEGAGARHSFGPIELVLVDPRSAAPPAPELGLFRTWARVRGSLKDDPNLHRCALTYASDIAAVEPSMRAVGTRPGDPDMQVASLDHAIWFHRRFRFDDWLLFGFDCVSLAAERGLNRGYVYTPSGALVASIIQETMLRRRNVIASG
jgi:acyl-CoA thioesterase-2